LDTQRIETLGRRIGRYDLLYRFATGGMADIYLARLSGEEGVERLMAVKVIHSHLVSEREFVKMFIDEARLASRISHPNVATTFELGRVGGTHFIVMEYVDGESVGALIRNTSLSPSYAARIISDAAAGLHAAHELRGPDGQLLNVVHRDVSLSNILISYQGAVKIVDFGVARARGSLHEMSNTFKGKFGYTSPEQLLTPQGVDRRTDIFALGVVLFEMTTRRRLFKAPTAAETVERVVRGPLPRPSEIVEDFPPELERIIMRALARPAGNRQQTALELHEELEQFIASSGSPVPTSALGKMMQSVFADRIVEKRKFLEDLPTDGPPVVVPEEQKSDSSSSDSFGSSVVRAAGLGRSTPFSVLRNWVSSHRWLVLGGSAAVAVVLAVLVVWGRDKSPPVKTPPPKVAARDAAPATSHVAKPDSAIRDSTAWISIVATTTPAEATLTLDGKPVDNPLVLKRPPGTGEVELVARAPGHLRQTIKVPLDRGGTWQIKLPRGQAAPTKTVKGTKKKKKGLDSILDNPY